MTQLGALTWPGVAQRWSADPARALALVPVGSTEAHGPHLPLAADTLIALAVAERTGRLLEERGFAPLVLPPISYGVTLYAGGFAGTVSVRRDTVVALLADVCESLARQGVKGVALVNHHLEPAHFDAVHAAVAEARKRSPGCAVVAPDHRSKRWGPPLGEEFCRGGSHAGQYETSLLLAATPALVGEERERLPPRPVDLARAIREGAKSFREIEGGDAAYFGDPRAASAAEGERALDHLAGMTAVTLLEALSALAAAHVEP